MPDRAIVGLGNPGPRYEATRHNAGFLVLDRLAGRHGLALARERGAGAAWGDATVAGRLVRLVKPLRFMNRSGEVAADLLVAAGIAPADILVVHDELDLPFGTLRLKLGGGIAGHRGVCSLVEHLAGDASFARLRFGIGRPGPATEVVDHVLAPFSPGECVGLGALLDRAADACEAWLALGAEAAMNRVNARVRPGGGRTGGPPEAGTVGGPGQAAPRGPVGAGGDASGGPGEKLR